MRLRSFQIRLLFLFCSVSISTIQAQSDELILDDHIYVSTIKTPQTFPKGNVLGDPFIRLGTQSILVTFDDLTGDYKDLYFSVVHCNQDWEISDLDRSDYLEGFFSNSITEFEQSFNTYTDYTHYQLEFPNDMCRLTKSGNFILYVYEDDDEDQLILSRRFIAYEDLVRIDGQINPSSIVSKSSTDQEVDVQVFHNEFQITDPYSDFNLTILQNSRWDNAITELKPRFVKNNELDFDFSKENNFQGGNEYRNFENKDMGFISPQVFKNGILEEEWHTILIPDQKRAYRVYTNNPDINGKFFIRNDAALEANIEEEYAWVHFSLPMDNDLGTNEVFIFGQLSDNQYKEEFKMTYNREKKAYENTILLKQGYYNYLYLTKPNMDGIGTTNYTEGNHFQTQNKYTVIAYNRDFYEDYDRVVGLISLGLFE